MKRVDLILFEAHMTVVLQNGGFVMLTEL